MAKYLFFCVSLLIPIISHGQTIRIDNGYSYISIRDCYENSSNLKRYSFSVGLDYLEKKTSFLSSQVGFSPSRYYYYYTDYFGDMNDKSDFISDNLFINTLINGKLPFNLSFAYFGAGPEAHFSINKRNYPKENSFHNLNEFKNIVGIKFVGGLTFNINKFNLGINCDYFDNLGIGDYNKKSITFNLSTGLNL